MIILHVSEMVKNCRQFESAVTETTQGASNRIGVCPRVVKIESVGKNQRVPIRIYNVSAKKIKITPKTTLGELQEIKVLRYLEVGTVKGGKVESCQQR